MKFNINRQTGIISAAQESATLMEITKNGQFHYLVRYRIDLVRALKNGGSVVKISVSNHSPESQEINSFSQLNTQNIIQNLLTRQTQKIEKVRSFQDSYIKTIVSDITAIIPNNKTNLLKNSRNTKTINSEEKLFQEKRFDLVRASELTQENVSQPILQTPLYQPQLRKVSPPFSPQEQSYNLLKHGVDPSSIGHRTNLYADTERAHQGVLQSVRGVAKRVLEGSPQGAIQPAFGLMNSFLGTPKDKPSDQTGLTNNDFTHVLVNIATNEKEVEEDLLLNLSDISDGFYLIFSFQDTKGIEIERFSTLVQHSRLMAIFTLPIIPPSVFAANDNGFTKLQIKQLDANAAGVYIYRRTLELETASTEAAYAQIAKIPLKVEDGEKVYKDSFCSTRPTIYRIVSYNRSELKSHDFSSVVVNLSANLRSFKISRDQKKLFVSINTKILGRSIEVEINDIPPGVLSFKICRKDLTRHQKNEESTFVGNAIYLPNLSSPNSRYYVTDTVPVDGRIYEYLVLLTFRDGTELWAIGSNVIQFTPVLNNIISTTATSSEVVRTGNELDVQFVLKSVITEGKIDQIRKALEQQGLLGFFQDDITKNREHLQNLIAYQIVRTDLTTGEKVDLGVFIGTRFSDQQIGKNRGVPAPTLGHLYEYTINTHFRSAQSLISTFTTDVVNTVNPSLSYSFKPSRWQHPIVLKEGNLVSPTTLQRNHANTDFTFGAVGDIFHLRIDLTEPMPSIQEATAKFLGNDKVLVQWSIKGPIKKIDHFIVTKEEMGMKTVVGKTHALTESSFQFIDTNSLSQKTSSLTRKNETAKPSTLQTSVTYQITPVYFDYTQGVSIKTQQIVGRKIK